MKERKKLHHLISDAGFVLRDREFISYFKTSITPLDSKRPEIVQATYTKPHEGENTVEYLLDVFGYYSDGLYPVLKINCYEPNSRNIKGPHTNKSAVLIGKQPLHIESDERGEWNPETLADIIMDTWETRSKSIKRTLKKKS